MNKKQGSKQTVAIIVLSLALLTALGWIFYQNFIFKQTPQKDTEIIAVNKNKSSVDKEKTDKASSSWFNYMSVNKKYIVAIPDGWSLSAISNTDNITAWTADKIKYAEGKKSIVETSNDGRDGSSTAFYLLYDYKVNQGAFLSPDLKKINSFVTSQGIKVDKYSRTQQTRGDEMSMDIPVGTKEYTYDFYKDNVRVHIVHDILKGEVDQSSTIEQMLDTFKFI